jgi:hypothetical protein
LSILSDILFRLLRSIAGCGLFAAIYLFGSPPVLLYLVRIWNFELRIMSCPPGIGTRIR